MSCGPADGRKASPGGGAQPVSPWLGPTPGRADSAEGILQQATQREQAGGQQPGASPAKQSPQVSTSPTSGSRAMRRSRAGVIRRRVWRGIGCLYTTKTSGRRPSVQAPTTPAGVL